MSKFIAAPTSHFAFWVRSVISTGFLIVGLFPAATLATPLLRCKIDQGGSTQVLEFTPVNDPYTVKAIDINGRFRFKAVVVGDARQVEYIKLYTYDHPKRQPVLLHEAKYAAPVVQPNPLPAALTGVNYVYSPRLERELQYECALLEAAP
ncbi:hypothetical protein SCT_1876 [Sulfuricella sp. T08]|uniref:hypothetical protein n=1 Tax=Sulfuricella sp. T08 TaxID=1632857 RepID=UPI000617A052|nr:hypothetical protein [Sulfuricella sp. T08]GAO36469.1 hypothetical protein SCT_1876 [Sulfuricella sp. T08]